MISRGNSQRLPSFGAFAGLVAILASCILLTGCGPSDSYKYKLTLSVDTPDGVKSGFSVVEVHVTQAPAFWGGGVGSTARGEAVYVDLGPGRRPLIAVMTLYRAKTKGMIWAEGKPDDRYLLSRYGQPQPDDDFVGRVSRLKRHRGPLALTSADLPDLVTFADINDPRSVLAVDPHNLPASLGPGVTWRAMTIEITDEPITSGIEKKLAWLVGLPGALDGDRLRRYGAEASFSNSLSATNFLRRR